MLDCSAAEVIERKGTMKEHGGYFSAVDTCRYRGNEVHGAIDYAQGIQT